MVTEVLLKYIKVWLRYERNKHTTLFKLRLCNHAMMCDESKGELEKKQNLVELFCSERIDFERL